MTSQVIFFILAAVVVVSLSTLISFLFFRQRSATLRTRLFSPNSAGSLLDVDVPDNFTGTGADDEGSVASPEQQLNAQSAVKLRGHLPLKFDNATLSYSYKEFKFIVEPCPPVETGIDQVEQWLSENGFDQIPSDQFVYRPQAVCPGQ